VKVGRNSRFLLFFLKTSRPCTCIDAGLSYQLIYFLPYLTASTFKFLSLSNKRVAFQSDDVYPASFATFEADSHGIDSVEFKLIVSSEESGKMNVVCTETGG
jgi:hypothetical protein